VKASDAATATLLHRQPFSAWFRGALASGPPLRVGLVVAGTELLPAAADVADDVIASEFAEVALVMVLGDGAPGLDRDPRRPMTLPLYRRLDRKRFPCQKDPLALEDRSTALANLPRVDIPARQSVNEQRLAAIADARLDVIVNLSSADMGWLADAAAQGVWSLRYGHARSGDLRTAFIQELAEGRPTVEVVLERRVPGTPPEALARTVFATEPGSILRTQARAFFGSSFLVIRALRDLHAGLEPVAPPADDVALDKPAPRRPTDWDLLRWVTPLVARKVRQRLSRVLRRSSHNEQWCIAFRTSGGQGFDGPRSELARFRWVRSPGGRYYADPFLIRRDGRTWVFIEEYQFKLGKGVLSYAEVRSDGGIDQPIAALETPSHLSYPYLVTHGDDVYMIRRVARPASWGCTEPIPSRLVDAGEHPYDGPALDTSVVQWDDRWWFFTTSGNLAARARC